MDMQLHLLETFPACGTDGALYKVCAYERLVADPTQQGQVERWAPSGVMEYRLDDGRVVETDAGGRMRIRGTDTELVSEKSTASA